VVAADGQRPHAARGQLRIITFNVLEGLFQTIAAAKRNVADVRCAYRALGHHAEGGVIGADPFDGPNGTRAESGPWAIGHAKVHRHSDERNVQVSQIRR
jgi:hypothetical protein